MAKQNIPIEQLDLGMFVIGLDVSWLATPFFRHSMLITNEQQILALKSCGAKLVTIDTEKGTSPTDSVSQNKIKFPVKEKQLTPTSLRDELAVAKNIKESTKKLMRVLFSLVQEGGTPKVEMISTFVDQTMDSLSRNSQAIINLFLSKRQTSKLYSHAFNVMSMSLLVAQKLGYSEDDQKRLGLAGLLMDIGWLKLPEQLFVLQTGYTDTEFSFIKQHVDYGLQVIERGDFDPEVHQTIAQHHERYDGNGYPAGLTAEQIHPMSRIVSLIDHFDSLTNGYYDRPPMIPARALQEIYKKSLIPSHDPALVELLVRVVGIYPPSSAVLLNTGERGIITQVNWRAPLAPKVRIFYNKKLTPLMRPIEIDLATQENNEAMRKIRSLIDPNLPGQDPANLLSGED